MNDRVGTIIYEGRRDWREVLEVHLRAMGVIPLKLKVWLR